MKLSNKNTKFLMLICLMSISSMANSQILISLLLGDKLNSPKVEFGLHGGLNFSQIANTEYQKHLKSFNLGFYFNIRLKEENTWFLHTGVIVKSKMGTGKLSTSELLKLDPKFQPNIVDGTYSQVLNSFYVPILAKYRFKNRLFIEAGPQLGWTYNSWTEFNADNDQQTIRIRDYNHDKVNPIDAGIAGGIGYTLMEDKGMSFGARYYYGFVDAYKDISGTKNRSIYAYFCIPIGK